MTTKARQKGFTIVELLIASAVFSTVLLICAAGMLQIGRVYYKGITSSQTQEATRSIIEDITKTIQFNGGNVGVINVTGDTENPQTPSFICIGDKRYTFVLNNQLVPAPAGDYQSRHVLVVDGGSCSGPAQRLNDNPNTLSGDARELMPVNMRLTKFAITKVSGADDLYSVTIRVVAGHNDILKRTDTANPNRPDWPGECVPNRLGGQFCAVSELSTTVQKRVK